MSRVVRVRPERPNGAASGFLSGIVREPLAGVASVCPVPLDTEVALASPARTIGALLRVYEARREELGGRSALNLPALSVRVGDMLNALEAVAGRAVRALRGKQIESCKRTNANTVGQTPIWQPPNALDVPGW